MAAETPAPARVPTAVALRGSVPALTSSSTAIAAFSCSSSSESGPGSESESASELKSDSPDAELALGTTSLSNFNSAECDPAQAASKGGGDITTFPFSSSSTSLCSSSDESLSFLPSVGLGKTAGTASALLGSIPPFESFSNATSALSCSSSSDSAPESELESELESLESTLATTAAATIPAPEAAPRAAALAGAILLLSLSTSFSGGCLLGTAPLASLTATLPSSPLDSESELESESLESE